MKKYMIMDNDNQIRNVVIHAETQNEAMSHGASILKTCNVRSILTNQEKGTINLRGFNY